MSIITEQHAKDTIIFAETYFGWYFLNTKKSITENRWDGPYKTKEETLSNWVSIQTKSKK